MPRLPQLALLAAGLVLPLLAEGAAQRTFVASTGVDTNPCSISLPCRSFGQAATQTSPNGEIVVLDSAGYGPVTITQSLSIIAPPGVHAGVSVFVGNGIWIDGSAIRVVLRGLTINGQGGTSGIVVVDAESVHVENVVVSGMLNVGIVVNASSRVFVNDSLLRNNGGNGLEILPPDGGLAQVSVDRLRIEGNLGSGIYVDNNVRLDVRDSVIARNAGSGIDVYPDSGETVSVGVSGSAVSNNTGSGILARGAGSGVVVVGGCVIKDNHGVGLSRTALVLTVYTRQNNTIVNNDGGDVSAGLTPLGGL